MILRAVFLLLPAVLPSWRFFKDVAPSPRIEARTQGDWVPLLDWPEEVPVLESARRLVWNPGWNAQLFLVSLAERVVATQDTHAVRALTDAAAARLGVERTEVSLRISLCDAFEGHMIEDVVFETGPREVPE